MSLTKLQTKIEKAYTRPIRLEKTKKKRKESMHEFLINFFTEWNNERNTIHVDNRQVQTSTGRRRSLGDIYMICKYYYPNITLQDVIKELYSKLPDHFPKGFRTSYCSTINKRVWYYNSDEVSRAYDRNINDEWGKLYSFYLSFVTDVEICPDCEFAIDECECD